MKLTRFPRTCLFASLYFAHIASTMASLEAGAFYDTMETFLIALHLFDNIIGRCISDPFGYLVLTATPLGTIYIASMLISSILHSI